MRKLFPLLAALIVVNVALLFVHPSRAAQPTTAGTNVGIVLDVGGLGDKSFNDGADRGAVRAEKELGAHVRLVEPGEATDREAGLRLLAAEHMDLVIGVGFIFTDDITQLAKEYPNINFAAVDYSVATDSMGKPVLPPPNVAALKFKEEEGSFLVGALAAMVGGSKKVGFVGGMDVPLIQKFEAGYRAGVKYVCPDCTVIAQYAGVTPEAFRNPGKGKELALNQYQQGVNVIYHASGATGIGVFEAARQTGKYAIGVDADQYDEAPGHVLTSMVKGIDVAVFDMIQRVKAHTFKGGIYTFGLAQNGVGYVYDEHNRALIPDSVRTRLERIKADIIAGKIVVPSTR
jgi:basic membrane protein A